mmetsp:Transcript_18002/g.29789  ORF Transcript_18002/g.29789 Transcript_18002/m.29789 type:complete len:92 (+) Transcript_18002:44-319(+)
MCGFSMHGRIFKKCTIAPYATKGSMISQTTGVTRFCIVRTNHLCVSGVKGTLSKDNISSNTIAAADERHQVIVPARIVRFVDELSLAAQLF